MATERVIDRGAGRLLEPGVLAMALERVELAAGERHELPPAGSGDEVMAYVVRGAGEALIGGAAHPVADEAVVWLEPGDACTLLAGDAGLVALIARAGASASSAPGGRSSASG